MKIICLSRRIIIRRLRLIPRDVTWLESLIRLFLARLLCFEAGFFQEKKNIPRVARLSDFELMEINKIAGYFCKAMI